MISWFSTYVAHFLRGSVQSTALYNTVRESDTHTRRGHGQGSLRPKY